MVAPSRQPPFLGYHASHEQHPPSELLALVQLANEVGFKAAMCSDHLMPWTTDQAQSGHAWSWLGAAMQATDMTFGVVTAPGQRYHPTVAAHGIATLSEMFPGRFWAALGSGEALNEHVTGEPWPAKSIRDERLVESARVIRRLLAGEEVSHQGRIHVDRARIWSLPDHPPALLGAALSEQTARLASEWADGLITVFQPEDQLARIVRAFRSRGPRRPVYVQVHLALAATRDQARELARRHWRIGGLDRIQLSDVDSPQDFDRLSAEFDGPDLDDSVLMVTGGEELVERLGRIAAFEVDGIYLHHVGLDQREFLEVARNTVLPAWSSVAHVGD